MVPQTVSIARATLCELVASRVLRRFHEENPGLLGIVTLAKILVQGFDPFQGAPKELVQEARSQQWVGQQRGGHGRKLTALELAILSESKTFIGSSACQRVVDAVYQGRVIYTPISFMDIIPDHYKHHPVSLYDPRKASVLNHYRLIVPRSRNIIEFFHFATLVGLYLLVMLNRNSEHLYIFEVPFCVYTVGWILDEFAAIVEHGWEVHAQNLWSFLDVSFTAIFGVYAAFRLFDLFIFPALPQEGYGLSILCIAAPVLLTRVAFNMMPNNIVFIAIHAMMKDFTLLTFIAVWCFTGFLLALQWLIRSNENLESVPSWATVCKWLLWIWFGLDGTGIDESGQFHVVLGPALMVAFAFLGNTLFLTILVAMLTNTFSKIISNETAEVQFRRAALTFQGVKSDAIFSYPPPFNILALILLLPLKLVLSARMFHILNVTLIRIINLPALLLISMYERREVWQQQAEPSQKSSLLHWNITSLSPHGDIQAVFKVTPPTKRLRRTNQRRDTRVEYNEEL
jgi:hypothetical protein